MAFFDPARPGYLANPYPALAQLRREDPVHWSAGVKAWVATRYEECAEVLHAGDRFTTDPARTEGPRASAIMAHRASVPLGEVATLGSTSGEAHRRLRGIVNPVFAPGAVRSIEPRIADLVGKLLAGMPRGEPFEFMAGFADPLPRLVMNSVMGFPEDGEGFLQRSFATIETTRSNAGGGEEMVEAARRAQSEANQLLAPYLSNGLRPATVLGALAADRTDGRGLGIDEITSVAAHISTVGSDPTTGAIANSVAALANHPGAMNELRREPGRIRTACHELLRYDSPTHIAPRFAVVDSVLAGRKVRRGDAVLVMVGAANRDPAAFHDPDRLDIDRDARRQLSFGQGEHLCLGASLALSIMENALNGLLSHFDSIELMGSTEYGSSIGLRVPDRMLVRVD